MGEQEDSEPKIWIDKSRLLTSSGQSSRSIHRESAEQGAAVRGLYQADGEHMVH